MSAIRIACLLPLMLTTLATAQSAPPAQLGARAASVGEHTVKVFTRWEADGDGRGRLIAGGETTTLYEGRGGAATVTAGHGRWLVAYEVDLARDPFRVRVVSRQGARITVGEEVRMARPGDRHDMPFAVAATATPDGFSVFFQEIQEDDPSAAHTYLARLDESGQPAGALSPVAIPWALADALWNGDGYHLALKYFAPTGMRLSMVSTTPEGRPQQHPDWASVAGMVSDVHLATSGERILAFYGNGGTIFESDVTQIGAWGREPPAARRRGRLASSHLMVLRVTGAAVRPIAVAR